mmetsp:Transcript_25568/g.42065  ORF Transcript_25568/g.42065 Transcript_25568/m.42065 type:complete len:205 (+) Transcript_25568:587-1201(+)
MKSNEDRTTKKVFPKTQRWWTVILMPLLRMQEVQANTGVAKMIQAMISESRDACICMPALARWPATVERVFANAPLKRPPKNDTVRFKKLQASFAVDILLMLARRAFSAASNRSGFSRACRVVFRASDTIFTSSSTSRLSLRRVSFSFSNCLFSSSNLFLFSSSSLFWTSTSFSLVSRSFFCLSISIFSLSALFFSCSVRSFSD